MWGFMCAVMPRERERERQGRGPKEASASVWLDRQTIDSMDGWMDKCMEVDERIGQDMDEPPAPTPSPAPPFFTKLSLDFGARAFF